MKKNIIIAILAFMSVTAIVYGYSQKNRADEQEALAMENINRAEQAELMAKKNAEEAMRAQERMAITLENAMQAGENASNKLKSGKK
ncbi:MAG: hypothetical protein HOP08_03195 [Cyclobacteriaceae bacterium]|nr:hypothetical protein [Cyclobacteriaceae bacterium]